jgi:hypothetical protein
MGDMADYALDCMDDDDDLQQRLLSMDSRGWSDIEREFMQDENGTLYQPVFTGAFRTRKQTHKTKATVMAATLINPNEIIAVSNPPVLVYGVPGCGKTSITQTADNSITLDFDGGIHRSQFRKAAMRFDTWEDVIFEQKAGRFEAYDTIVIDTVDSMLKYISQSVIRENRKNGMSGGALSQQGWGALKMTFDNWIAGLRRSGKQIIMIAHQREDKDGDNRRMRPDIAGGSYGIVMNNADIIGYISYRNNLRFVTFDPTDEFFAKNGARLQSQEIPNFFERPHFMAELLANAKTNLGYTAEASASMAKAMDEWRAKLSANPDLAAFNAMLPAMGTLPGDKKKAVWGLVCNYAESKGWMRKEKEREFTVKVEQTETTPERQTTHTETASPQSTEGAVPSETAQRNGQAEQPAETRKEPEPETASPTDERILAVMNELKRIEFDPDPLTQSMDPAADLTALSRAVKAYPEAVMKQCSARIVEFARRFGFIVDKEKKCWVMPAREQAQTAETAGVAS